MGLRTFPTFNMLVIFSSVLVSFTDLWSPSWDSQHLQVYIVFIIVNLNTKHTHFPMAKNKYWIMALAYLGPHTHNWGNYYGQIFGIYWEAEPGSCANICQLETWIESGDKGLSKWIHWKMINTKKKKMPKRMHVGQKNNNSLFCGICSQMSYHCSKRKALVKKGWRAANPL